MGNIILSNGGTGDSPFLEFKRGTNDDDYTDWRIIDITGDLHFKSKSLGSNWSTLVRFYSDGQVQATSFSQISDIRKKDIKENITIDIAEIANAPIFKFTWIDQEMSEGVNVGTSAQYWQSILPQVVHIGNDEKKTLSMQYDVAALVSVVSLAREVQKLKEQIKGD